MPLVLAWTFALGLGLAPLAGCQQLSNWNAGIATFYVSKGLSLTDAPFELRSIQQLERAWHGVANWCTESLQRAIAGAQPQVPRQPLHCCPHVRSAASGTPFAPDHCCNAAPHSPQCLSRERQLHC